MQELSLLAGQGLFFICYWFVLESLPSSSNGALAENGVETSGVSEPLETKQKIEKFVKATLGAQEDAIAAKEILGDELRRSEKDAYQPEAQEPDSNAAPGFTPVEKGKAGDLQTWQL